MILNLVCFFSVLFLCIPWTCESFQSRTLAFISNHAAKRKQKINTANFIRFSPPFSGRCDEFSSWLKHEKRWGGNFLGPCLRYLNSCVVGVLFSFILKVLNSFKTIRFNILLKRIWGRGKEVGLISCSNHQSFYDDPGLWAAMLPFWVMRPEQLRWSICAEEVFFANKYLQSILGAGNVIPLDRSGSLDQPLFERVFDKLNAGSWIHIFPEGKVRQNWRYDDDEPRLSKFKVGVGKLVAHAKVTPLVIPMYHVGMDGVCPEVVLENKKSKRPSRPISYAPRGGNDIRVYFGEPLDFGPRVRAFREAHPGVLDSWASTERGIALYTELTHEIRQAVLALEAEARGGGASASAGAKPVEGNNGLSLA